jgi:hypothetical protein
MASFHMLTNSLSNHPIRGHYNTLSSVCNTGGGMMWLVNTIGHTHVITRKINTRWLSSKLKLNIYLISCSHGNYKFVTDNYLQHMLYIWFLQQNIVCAYWPSFWRSPTCYLRNVLYMTYEHCSTLPVGLTWHNGPTAWLRNKQSRGWMGISCLKRSGFSTSGQNNIQTQTQTYHSYSNYEV